jgi:cullin 3
MGSADLKATFGAKRHELNVSTYQVQQIQAGKLMLSTRLLLSCLMSAKMLSLTPNAVSWLQACILMLFNESETLSFSDVSAATGIPPAELKRNLQSLACVKVRARSHTMCCVADAGRQHFHQQCVVAS